jgi:hypothetical protein
MPEPSRRGLIFGLMIAPAIVRASSLMAIVPLYPLPKPGELWLNWPDYLEMGDKLSRLFRNSIAEPSLKGHFATVSNYEICCVETGTPRSMPVPVDLRGLLSHPLLHA